MAEQSAAKCSLCGKDNHCAMAAGEPAATCWCLSTEFDDSIKDKLAELDPEVCICQACATAKGASPIER